MTCDLKVIQIIKLTLVLNHILPIISNTQQMMTVD